MFNWWLSWCWDAIKQAKDECSSKRIVVYHHRLLWWNCPILPWIIVVTESQVLKEDSSQLQWFLMSLLQSSSGFYLTPCTIISKYTTISMQSISLMTLFISWLLLSWLKEKSMYVMEILIITLFLGADIK